MSKKTVSYAESVAEGGRPLKRGATAVINASEDDDDIFKTTEPKRRRADEGDTGEKNEAEDVPKSKHTLDSDEEDDEKYERLDTKKVDGQEDGTIDYDGDTKITAFNMKEEEEDGHFDATGNFIFNKKEKDIQDAWLDGIDWSRVKKKAGKDWKGDKEEDENMDELPVTLNDQRKRELLEKLLDMLKPEQTVTKALAQLKKIKGMTAAEERKARWAAKKEGKVFGGDDSTKKALELSAVADELLSAGHMDAYEWPREKVNFLLNKLQPSAVDNLDMFGDAPVGASSSTATSMAGGGDFDDDDEVHWEYKEDIDGEVKGPFTSAQMAQKQGNDEIGAKAVVRKVGQASFNPAARIDFDLYV